MYGKTSRKLPQEHTAVVAVMTNQFDLRGIHELLWLYVVRRPPLQERRSYRLILLRWRYWISEVGVLMIGTEYPPRAARLVNLFG
jgi:hypothetical protein